MNRMKMIMENASTMECALKTLGYAMEFISYIDHDEEKIREIANNIAGSIECLQYYQKEITDVISNEIYFENEHVKDDKEHVDVPDRADEADALDYEKIESAALDTDRARAMVGCIISALHDQGGDNTDTKIKEMSCWELRASLEVVYNILKDTAFVMFETSEMIEWLSERKKRVKDEEDHGQDSI